MALLSNALALLLLSQVPIPSVTVPPTTERSIVFQDRGRVYIVGVDSGRVTTLDNSPAPNPTPDDDVTPEPVPPVSVPYKWATIVIDRNDSERNAWRDNAAIRDAVKAKGASISFLGSDERDIELRGLRPTITEKGLPVLFLWDAEKKLITAKKVETEAELLGALK